VPHSKAHIGHERSVVVSAIHPVERTVHYLPTDGLEAAQVRVFCIPV
jgi:hypothetical protein